MRTRNNVFIWIMILLASHSLAQEVRLGMLPSLNLNKSLKNDWRLNLTIEGRNSLLKEQLECSQGNNQEYIHTDYTLIAAKRVGFNKLLAAGVMWRYKENQLILRYLQQFVLIKKYNSFRMAHRFALDQTESQNAPTKFRIRYRATLELPLSGTSIDPKEWYLKINNEYLNSFQDKEQSLEMRVVPLVGYKFSEKSKLETGVDYRRNDLLSDDPHPTYWVSLKWYLIL